MLERVGASEKVLAPEPPVPLATIQLLEPKARQTPDVPGSPHSGALALCPTALAAPQTKRLAEADREGLISLGPGEGGTLRCHTEFPPSEAAKEVPALQQLCHGSPPHMAS